MQKKFTGEKFGPEKIIAQYLIRIVQRLNLAGNKISHVQLLIFQYWLNLVKFLNGFQNFSFLAQGCRHAAFPECSGFLQTTLQQWIFLNFVDVLSMPLKKSNFSFFRNKTSAVVACLVMKYLQWVPLGVLGITSLLQKLALKEKEAIESLQILECISLLAINLMYLQKYVTFSC